MDSERYDEPGSWDQYKRLVLKELERGEQEREAVRQKLDATEKDLDGRLQKIETDRAVARAGLVAIGAVLVALGKWVLEKVGELIG